MTSGWYIRFLPSQSKKKSSVLCMLLCRNGPQYRQFKPVQQSRLEALRAYCTSTYTMATTIFSFNHKEVTAANRIRALAKQLTLKSFVSKNFVSPKTHSFKFEYTMLLCFSLAQLIHFCILKAHHNFNFTFFGIILENEVF